MIKMLRASGKPILQTFNNKNKFWMRCRQGIKGLKVPNSFVGVSQGRKKIYFKQEGRREVDCAHEPFLILIL